MNVKTILIAFALLHPTTWASAQHSDIAFGYKGGANPTGITIQGSARTVEDIQLFASDFIPRDPFNPNDFSSDQPGFATSANANLLVGAGDQILLTALDASLHSSFGAGFVNFYNPATNLVEAAGRLAIVDNSSGTSDVVLNGASIESGAADIDQFIASGNSQGRIHNHLIVDLLDDASAQAGAYGILFQLQGDVAAADGTPDLASEPFWIVWNYDISNDDFDSLALPAFGFGEGVSLEGDFDNDGDVDQQDLDRYIGNLGQPASGALSDLDLNGDEVVDEVDFTRHYSQLLVTSNGGRGTFQGDANLDGVVDIFGDGFTLLNNIGQAATSWSQGDFDANGQVDIFGDGFALLNNIGRNNAASASAPPTSAVPEPGYLTVLVIGTAAAGLRRRK